MDQQQLPQLMIRRSGNAPMFIYQPKNNRRLIFLARLRNATVRAGFGIGYLAGFLWYEWRVVLAFAVGVAIGAVFF